MSRQRSVPPGRCRNPLLSAIQGDALVAAHVKKESPRHATRWLLAWKQSTSLHIFAKVVKEPHKEVPKGECADG